MLVPNRTEDHNTSLRVLPPSRMLVTDLTEEHNTLLERSMSIKDL